MAQRGAGARFEWGAAGASAVREPSGCLVVVDVLSFCTAVSVAIGRGMAVLAYDPARPGARDFADGKGAVARGYPHGPECSPALVALADVSGCRAVRGPAGTAFAQWLSHCGRK